MHDEKGERLPRLHGETLQIVPDGNAQYLRFLAGQIDVYTPRPEEVVDLREKQKQLGITLKEIGIDTGSLFFAFNRNPQHYVHNGVTDPKYRWFTDLRFMRAIAHAIDKQGMINLCFHGLAVPAVSDVSPANKVFHNPNLKDYDYSLKQAGDLLEQAGYHLRNGVRYDPEGHRLEFNLATNTGVNVRDEMCVILQAGPFAPRHQGELPAAGIHHPRRQTRLHLDWDVRADRLYRRNRAQQRRRLPALVGRRCTCGIRKNRSRPRRGRPRLTNCSSRARW